MEPSLAAIKGSRQEKPVTRISAPRGQSFGHGGTSPPKSAARTVVGKILSSNKKRKKTNKEHEGRDHDKNKTTKGATGRRRSLRKCVNDKNIIQANAGSKLVMSENKEKGEGGEKNRERA